MTREERDKLLNDLKEFWWGSGFDADGLYHSILTRIINALPVSDPAPVTPTCDGNCKGKWYSFIPDDRSIIRCKWCGKPCPAPLPPE